MEFQFFRCVLLTISTVKPVQIRVNQRDESLKILNTKVALRAFEIAAIAGQLTSDLSQEPLLAALRGLFLRTGESFLFALEFEQDWTELRSFEVLHLNASFTTHSSMGGS